MKNNMEDLGHWILADSAKIRKETDLGFVYIITLPPNEKGKSIKYIGKKLLVSATKKTVKLKNGKSVKRKTTKESTWKSYTSSSTYINEYIAKNGKDKIEFKIISWHSAKSTLAYYEAKMQFDCNALMDDSYINGIINLRISKLSKDAY